MRLPIKSRCLVAQYSPRSNQLCFFFHLSCMIQWQLWGRWGDQGIRFARDHHPQYRTESKRGDWVWRRYTWPAAKKSQQLPMRHWKLAPISPLIIAIQIINPGVCCANMLRSGHCRSWKAGKANYILVAAEKWSRTSIISKYSAGLVCCWMHCRPWAVMINTLSSMIIIE
jgi:hypothetical protein